MILVERNYGNFASHNPKSDNGIKWILQGEPPSPEIIQQVGFSNSICLRKIEKIVIYKNYRIILFPEFCLKYQQSLLSDIQLKRPLKVALDGFTWCSRSLCKTCLRKVRCEVIAIRCEAMALSQTMHLIHHMQTFKTVASGYFWKKQILYCLGW